LAPNTYTVTLTVRDDKLLPASQSTTATVAPSQPPVADAGGPYTGSVDTLTQFNGEGSSDADGIVQYDWDFGDGTTATDAPSIPTHTYLATGDFPVILTVTDGSGDKDSDDTLATISVGNQKPTADAGAPVEGVVGELVTFDGTASFDPDGTIQYDWDYGDGSDWDIDAGPTPDHTYNRSGPYTPTLRVTDDLGAVDYDGTGADINPDNVAPVADANSPYSASTVGLSVNFNGSGSSDPVGAAVSFDGTASSDPDGTIVHYDWDYGDGSPPDIDAGPTPSYAYSVAGTYDVILTVTDDQDVPDSTSTTANIGPVDLSGTVTDTGGTPLCSLVLASGQFMFTCNPNGPFSLRDLPRENDGSVKRQVYVDGFFPNVETLLSSVDETVTMTRANNCPDYNSFPDPGTFPESAGKRIDVSGTVLLQDTQTPVCAMVLGNGQFGFTCDSTGSYAANIPLDANGQYKLQVYADGFAPTIQHFDEFTTNVEVRLARAAECQ
jgi:PKD repeat protein